MSRVLLILVLEIFTLSSQLHLHHKARVVDASCLLLWLWLEATVLGQRGFYDPSEHHIVLFKRLLLFLCQDFF